jgi:hypothetical protein
VYTLRNDGRIDRTSRGATPSWNSPLSDVGTDISFVDMAIVIAEYELAIIPILLVIVIIDYLHRKSTKLVKKSELKQKKHGNRGVHK